MFIRNYISSLFWELMLVLLLTGTALLLWQTSRYVEPLSPAARSVAQLDLRSKTLGNRAAYIPPQCYTQTVDSQGNTHNPCYTCHIGSYKPNYINDTDLQAVYAFPDVANINHWLNLYKDRRQALAAISDQAIIDYVRQDNYQDANGQIKLRKILADVPPGWDFDGDGQWQGYVPDCYFNFDAQGFDRTPAGDYTGWRAFAYAPFPSTYWPTNGSTADVLIRLAEPLRRNQTGEFDLTVYKTNLAIVEALIKRRDIPIEPTDETRFGVDLDKNGRLNMTTRIVYDWAPLQDRHMFYVGQARQALAEGELHIAAGLFPEGTEFLQSLRYLDVDEAGHIRLAVRMKELRYAHKRRWLTYSELRNAAADENAEAVQFPDRLGTVYGDVESGAGNGQGWIYQGFIEAANGALRPQTYEETVYCVGCHSTVGVVTDGVYAFPRKFGYNSFRHGWYHWRQKSLAGTPEPRLANGEYEYSFYLRQNGAGDEFRENEEIQARFFTADGKLKTTALKRLHADMTYLLWPSRERALRLNKAYKQIVEEQSYSLGRDVTITPATNVHCGVYPEQPTRVERLIAGPLPLHSPMSSNRQKNLKKPH